MRGKGLDRLRLRRITISDERLGRIGCSSLYRWRRRTRRKIEGRRMDWSPPDALVMNEPGEDPKPDRADQPANEQELQPAAAAAFGGHGVVGFVAHRAISSFMTT